MADNRCEECCFFAYDEEYDEYYCDVGMDEDEVARLQTNHYRGCPYFRSGDAYELSRKQ